MLDFLSLRGLAYRESLEGELGEVDVVMDYLKVVLLVFSSDDAVPTSMESRPVSIKA